MLNNKPNNPTTVDEYNTRLERNTAYNKPTSIMENGIICYLFTAFFAIADFCCLQMSWNTVQTSSPWVITLIALSCAVCLDVPLAIAGVAFKAYRQGLKSKKDMLYIMIPSIAVFALVFVFCLIFKIITRTATFEDANGAGGLVNNLAEQSNPEESQSILFAALFSGIIPLATSISSFIIALRSTNPKKIKLQRLQRNKIKIEGQLTEIEQALTENDNIKANGIILIEREKDLFRQFGEEVIMVEGIRRQAANQALQEHLNTPDAVSVLSEYGAGVNKSYTGLEYEDSAKKIAEEFIENYNPIGVIFGNDDNLIDTDMSESAINLPSNNIEDSNETILEPYKTENKEMLEAS